MIRAVIFDLDGTITEPFIDFQELRRQLGVSPDQTIMARIASINGEGRWQAQAILDRVEEEAARASRLSPGALWLLSVMKKKGIRAALVTNNSRRSVDTVLKKHGLSFDTVLTREDGEPKPAPDLILRAMEIMGLKAEEVIMVGDGRYDLAAGKVAGIRTFLIGAVSSAGEEERLDGLEEVARHFD